jgi:hypothetical protein
MTDLERGYRRLLAFYPRAYRRARGEEIVAVLMACAADGQRRPGIGEAASLMRGGTLARLRPPGPTPTRTVRTAVRLMWLGALVELGVLAVIVATAGQMHAAILAHNPGYTVADWHAEFRAHVVTLEVAAPITAGVWLWLAWANRRGRGWARVAFLVFFGVQTASLLSGLAGGAFTYAPDDAVAGIALWCVALVPALLIFNPRSAAFYRRGSRRRAHEHAGQLGSAPGSPGA